MVSKWYNRISIVRARFAWSGFALMVLLQPTPVLKMLADAQFSVGPKLVHMFKWVAGAVITSTTYNSVTAATGDLSVEPGPGAAVGVSGEYMVFAIAGEDASIVTYSLDGELPSGLAVVLSGGVVTISGIPEATGVFPMKLSVLSWFNNPAYEPGSISINFNIQVTLEGPDITKSPQSAVVAVGSTAEFTVEVASEEGTTFQWQRNVGSSLSQFQNIVGATESTFSVVNVSTEDQGAFRVRVTRNGQTIIAPDSLPQYVFLTVGDANSYDTWKNDNFAESSADETTPLENPDDDSFSNAFEFLFDLDPEKADSIQAPEVSRELIGGTDYVVFRYPSLIDYPDLNYRFEVSQDLKEGPWAQLTDQLDGTIIETASDATILKVPNVSQRYYRVHIELED